jgi:lactate 2-monooxygenase
VATVVGMGREVQSRIYRNGVFGRMPAVPVEPAALEAAALGDSPRWYQL